MQWDQVMEVLIDQQIDLVVAELSIKQRVTGSKEVESQNIRIQMPIHSQETICKVFKVITSIQVVRLLAVQQA